jgi:hypothetical protein
MKKIIILLLLISITGCGQASDKISEIISIINKPSKNDIVKHLESDNCLKEFYTYWEYEPIKAFATSSDGSCGWSGSGFETDEAAKQEAITYCEQNRENGTPCKVVDLNGNWQ